MVGHRPDGGQISRYENGHMTPSAEAVVKLAEALDVSTDYLVVDASPRRRLHGPENALGDRITAVAELSDDELGVLRSVIDGPGGQEPAAGVEGMTG